NDTQILKQSTRAPSKLLGHNLEPDCEHLGYRFGISNGTAGMIQATGLGIAEHRNRRRRMENGLSEGLAAQGLFGVLYYELHRLAKRELAQRGAGARLGVTTLLHEAYLQLAKNDEAAFSDRAPFLRYAARVMRSLIIDDVRRGRASKRGGQIKITAINTD